MPTLRAAFGLCVACACGTMSQGSDGGLDADGTRTDAGVEDSPSDVSDVMSDANTPDAVVEQGDACSLIDGGAPIIIVQRSPTSAPLATGGLMQLGRYYATAITRYTGDGGATGPDPTLDPLAYTLELDTTSSGALRIDTSNSTQGAAIVYSTNQHAFDLTTMSCGASKVVNHFDFSTDGGALVLLPPDAGLGLGYFLERQ